MSHTSSHSDNSVCHYPLESLSTSSTASTAAGEVDSQTPEPPTLQATAIPTHTMATVFITMPLTIPQEMAWIPYYTTVINPGPTPLPGAYIPVTITPVPAANPPDVPGRKIIVPPNVTYLFPPQAEHAVIKLITKGYDTSLDPSVVQMAPEFTDYFVPLALTGATFLEQLGGGAGWKLLELYERGAGYWNRGMTIKYGEDFATKKTLKDYGFARGAIDPTTGYPGQEVWLAILKT
jgi:hypothetical protein